MPCMTVSTPWTANIFAPARLEGTFRYPVLMVKSLGQGSELWIRPIKGAVLYQSCRVVSRHLTSLHFLRCRQDVGEGQQPTFTRMNHEPCHITRSCSGDWDAWDRDSLHEVGGKGSKRGWKRALVPIPRRPSVRTGSLSLPYPVQI